MRSIEKSEALFARAVECMPGGVSSPVRAFRSVGGTPLFVRRGHGAWIDDEDGNAYIDYVHSWGPLILGHAHPEVLRAVHDAAEEGLTFGAPSRREILLAERILSAYPFCHKIRFVSSGTEATMSAIRLARAATGRDLIVKFEGCYHGHSDPLLIKGGSGLATFGVPSSAGVPGTVVGATLSLPLDDDAQLQELFRMRGHEIAAVIIEPVPANAGLLLQRREFLESLRALTRNHGAQLIFDEVISGFRVGWGGACAHYGIEPDIVCLGKIIGGGMPVGAYLAGANLMELVAPLGPMYQAGTLSGNPVAMAAGEATLRLLEDGSAYDDLERRTAQLLDGVETIVQRRGIPVQVVKLASLFWLIFQEGPAPRAYHLVEASGAACYARLHRSLLEQGVYFAPSAYEVGFVSTAHTPDLIDRTLSALDVALKEVFP